MQSAADKALWAYVSDWGDTDLYTEKEGVSTHFALVALLAHEDVRQAWAEELTQVCHKHFGAKALAGLGAIGADDILRERVLHDLVKVPFSLYAVLVDKRQIYKTSGLTFEPSFLKFLNGILYSRLFRASPYTQLLADERGRPEFVQDFERYVKERFTPDLFHREPSFCWVPSSQEPLVALSAFVAQTLGRIYDGKRRSILAGALRELLRPRMLHIEEWPFPKGTPRDESPEGATEHDKLIYQYCTHQAVQFLASHRDSMDPAGQEQTKAVQYLLHHVRFENAQEYLSTAKLLAAIGRESDQDHSLRSRVIGPLRDSGVIIASSPRGYKIPSSVRDMEDFVRMADNLVVPILNRLNEARRALYLRSDKQLDVVGGPQYARLRRLLGPAEGQGI